MSNKNVSPSVKFCLKEALVRLLKEKKIKIPENLEPDGSLIVTVKSPDVLIERIEVFAGSEELGTKKQYKITSKNLALNGQDPTILQLIQVIYRKGNVKIEKNVKMQGNVKVEEEKLILNPPQEATKSASPEVQEKMWIGPSAAITSAGRKEKNSEGNDAYKKLLSRVTSKTRDSRTTHFEEFFDAKKEYLASQIGM